MADQFPSTDESRVATGAMPNPHSTSGAGEIVGLDQLEGTGDGGPHEARLLAQRVTDPDDWGCEYCEAGGALVDGRCPKCDAEYPDEAETADGE